jgi:hypothetical protein
MLLSLFFGLYTMLSSRMKLASYYDIDEILAEQQRLCCKLGMNYVVGLNKAGPIVVISLPSVKRADAFPYSEEVLMNSLSRENEDGPVWSSSSHPSGCVTTTHHSMEFDESHDRYPDTSSSWMGSTKRILKEKEEEDILYCGTKLDLPLWLAQGLLLQ